jgi:hypothetical protein
LRSAQNNSIPKTEAKNSPSTAELCQVLLRKVPRGSRISIQVQDEQSRDVHLNPKVDSQRIPTNNQWKNKRKEI